MRVHWSSVRDLAGTGLFISTLSFNHVYTYLTAVALIPAIPLLIGALTYGFLGLTLIAALRDGVFRVREVIFGIAPLALILVVVLFHAAFITVVDQVIDRELLQKNVEILLRCLAFLLLGYYLGVEGLNRRMKLLMFSWGAMVINALVNSEYPSLTLRMPSHNELSGLYIFLGDTFAVCAVLFFATLRSTLSRLLVISLTITVLYAITSRTSLYTFLTIVPIALAFVAADGRGVEQRGALVIGLVLGALSVTALFVANLSVLSTRITRFIMFGEDTSWAFRQWQLKEGVAVIRDHPLLGSYGSDYFLLGRFGDYIHSYLEVWRQFGLIPFVLVVTAIIMPTRRILKMVVGGISTSEARAALLLMVFCIIQIVFSRTWGSAYVFLAIGMVGGCAKTSMRRRGRNGAYNSKCDSGDRNGGAGLVDPLRV